MAQTKEGARKAVESMIKRMGPEEYQKFIKVRSANGGRKSRGGGFTKNSELARIAGAKGGRASRRTKKLEKTPCPVCNRLIANMEYHISKRHQ